MMNFKDESDDECFDCFALLLGILLETQNVIAYPCNEIVNHPVRSHLW